LDHVNTLLRVDPTATEYAIDQPSSDSNAFDEILELVRTGSWKITESNSNDVSRLVQVLGNAELEAMVVESILIRDGPSPSNAVDRMRMKLDHHLDISDEVAFIAARFWTIEGLNGLEVGPLEAILASSELVVATEDWLLDFVMNRPDSDSQLLLRYVQCKYLSDAGIERFINSVTPNLGCDQF
jgi:hypothetical protein